MDAFDKLMDGFYLPSMPQPSLPAFISRSVLRGRYLFLDLAQRRSDSSPVACAGWEDCSPEYEIRRDGFAFHAVEYIAAGEWELKTAKGKWTLGPGSVFAYGPGLGYALKTGSRGPWGKYFLDFTEGPAVDELHHCGMEEGVPGTLIQRRWVHDLLDQLIDAAHLRNPARRRVARLTAELLLERLREDLRPVERPSSARLAYERCREYLSAHYLEIARLSDAARACGVSPVHLCRLFQRYGTEPPHLFLTRLKINHAAERIARSQLPVKAAAAEAGFEDPYHFSRVFKKIHGIAPSRFARP